MPRSPILHKIKRSFQLIKGVFTHFIDDDGMRLSASLSYYTIFSIAPFLIIVITVAGTLFDRDSVTQNVFSQVSGLIGPKAAIQLQEMTTNLLNMDRGRLGNYLGVILLVVGATGMFTEIQGSLNYMWSVKAKPRKGWLKLIINRLLSFSIVVCMGFLLLVSLFLNSLIDLLRIRLESYFSEQTVFIVYLINMVTLMAVTTLLFACIFKILPDARVSWRSSFIGGAFTSLLFLIGKFLIGLYIANSAFMNTFGTATSIIVILLWVYYSSIILYFGAAFTYQYANTVGDHIYPSEQAVNIIKLEKSPERK